MQGNLLVQFIDRSREWVRVKRGRELFRFAADAFRDLIGVDSGFFMYAKQLVHTDIDQAKIYAPWGHFEGHDESLQTCWDAGSSMFPLQRGRLFEIDELSDEVRDFYTQHGIKQVGVWEIRSRNKNKSVGSIVLACTHGIDRSVEWTISACVEQIGLILDMMMAWRLFAHNEKRYRSLVEHVPTGVVEIDLDGNVLYVNPAMKNITGFTQEEIQSQLRDLLGEEGWQNALSHYDRVLEGASATYELDVPRKDETRVSLSVINVPIIMDGEVVGLYALGRDITKQKMAEAAAIEARVLYRNLVEESLAGVYVVQDGKFSYVNHRLTEIFGYSEEEMSRFDVGDLLHPDDREQYTESLIEWFRGDRPSLYLESRAIRKDKTVINIETLGTRTIYRGRRAMTGMLIDITERKKSEEYIRKSEKLSVVGQLAAGVAHEIRNPLTAINGFVQLLSKREENARYCAIISEELKRLGEIVSEFLVIAKPQPQEFHDHDLSLLLKDVITLLNPHAVMNAVSIFFDERYTTPKILCDANQIKQVFINVIKNAIEAMPEGGQIRVQLTLQPSHAIIRFVDQGHGIDADRISNLGEPFYTTKEKGTGLGLTVSYRIIESHHGTISIQSQIHHGTTVEIRLPIMAS